MLTPSNNFAWKLRFAPQEVGNYSYYVTILDKNGTKRYPASGTLSFQSVASSSKGFVRVSPRDSRFMEFDNGESFIPNSAGHQWWTPGSPLRSLDYDQTFTEFGKNGINLVRIWDQNDGYSLTVEGRYDGYSYPDDFNPENRVNIDNIPKGTQMNQRGNYEEDKIIEAAERNGVYIQLTAHGDAYWIWDTSIYAKNPVAWDDPGRIRYWQRNFRYRVAPLGLFHFDPGVGTLERTGACRHQHGHLPVLSDLRPIPAADRSVSSFADYLAGVASLESGILVVSQLLTSPIITTI